MARDKEVSVIIDAKNKAKGAFLEVKRGLEEVGKATEKGLGKMPGAIMKVDKAVMSFADRMKWLDKIAKRTFQGTAAAAGVYVGTTLKDFAQLNDGISKVNTLYDQTSESQRKMYQDSIKMFKLIPTNFNKITQGIYDTISAGADPEYATMMARKFGMAGVAGDADMDVVTKAAMGTMNAYKLEAKDLTRILDLQFMTVKDGITSYSELASSLGTGVLASAKGAGITMEELYGSIAMITKNAIPANIATTSLNQLFNKFTDTKAIKEFKKFDVEIQDAQKHTRPLIEILKDLNAQFDKKKMTSEERKGYLKKLLGSDEAARAIMPLIGDLKEFQKILGDMDNSSGAMKDAFNDRLENIKTQIQLIWNNLKGLGVEQIYTLEPLINAISGPLIKKQKLELELTDLEDSIRLDPKKEKIYQQRIEEIKFELDNLDLIPLDDFREALSQSVNELNKLNPLLADIVDKVGTFIIDITEGGETRDKVVGGGKILLGLTGLSIGAKTFKNIFGKTIGEIISSTFKKAIEDFNYLKNPESHIKRRPEDRLPDGLLEPYGPTNMTTGIYIPRDYRVGGEKYNEFKKQILDIRDNKKDTNIPRKSVTDELLRIWKTEQKIDNNISMKSDIKIEPPNIKVYVNHKETPARVEINNKTIAEQTLKFIEIDGRRYGRA